jgi:glycosyltransferase involved in cell wall biosynthesis
VIRRIKPDVVQSVGLSVGGTLTYLAKSRSREKFPPWIAADWESQMQLLDYMSLGAIDPSAVLSSCDYYLCQSPRDLEEARNKRFLGQALPFFPNGGAIDISHCSQFRQPGPASKRRLILVNGCPQWPGRAFVALRAIERAAHQLDGYRVAVYQPLPEIEIKAELIAQDTGIPFDMIHHASNDDVFQLLGRSRVYLGLQVSGAVTSLFFHALAMGAFPIQSASSFADELKLLFYGYCVWISNGLTGLLVPPEDPGPVAEAICKAAVDDALVDNAAQENRRMVTQLLDIHQVRPQIMAMYEKVATDERIRLS